MKCAECGADNRNGARFCEQCGTRIALASSSVAAAPTGTTISPAISPDPAHESLLDDVVESMAKEPGTSKGPGFKLALIILLLILMAGVLWSVIGNRTTAPDDKDVPAAADSIQTGPLKAPSLAEQMGTSVTPVPPAVSDNPLEPAPAVNTSNEVKRTNDAKVKAKAARDSEQRKKNEEARLAQEERENAARKAAMPVRGLTTAQEVAQCEKMSVFARQPCLWRACNGKWGKDGCPSYD